MSENEEYTYNGNQGQVTMPAPEHRQTVTVVEGVSRSGGYVNNEYAATPAAPATDLSAVLAERAAEERAALAAEAAQFKNEIANGAQPAQAAPGVAQMQPVQTVSNVVQMQPVQTVSNVAQMQPVQTTPVSVQNVQPQAGPDVPKFVQPQVAQVQPQAVNAQPVRTQAVQVNPQSTGLQTQTVQQPAPAQTQAVNPQVPRTTMQPQAGQPQMQQTGQPQMQPQAQPRPAGPQEGPRTAQQPGSVPPSGGKGKKEKKRPNFFVRLLMAAACGLIFGLFAGGVILLMTRLVPGKTNPNPVTTTVVTSENVITEVKPVEKPSTEPDSGTALIGDGQEESINITEVTADMTVPEVANECMPAIVIINTLMDYNYYGYVQEVPASGTGVIVGMNEDDLFIATNYHVVQDAKEITVQFCDSSTANAEVKGKKVSTDLAVITVDLSSLGQTTQDSIKLARIGNSDNLVVGESCVAIGNALGYGQSVTTGVISALNREVTTETGETGMFIQTDAAINPGNSGGALLNMRGELIGINSNKRGGTTVEGMGYAIPINIARPIIEQLIEKKELQELPAEEQSYFGISGATVQSGATTSNGMMIPQGIYVSSVVAGSPAEKAGIQRGDIVTEFDGTSVVSIAELMQCLASYPSGVTVPVTYKRLENGVFVSHETQVTLESKSGSTANSRP